MSIEKTHIAHQKGLEDLNTKTPETCPNIKVLQTLIAQHPRVL